VIKSFKSKDAEAIFGGSFVHRLPRDLHRIIARKLEMLDAVTELDSLRVPPSNRLEKLKGNRKNQYSIRMNAQWRICFIWRGGDALDVEIVDYH